MISPVISKQETVEVASEAEGGAITAVEIIVLIMLAAIFCLLLLVYIALRQVGFCNGYILRPFLS